MESLSLLPALQALPAVDGVAELTPAEMMPRVRAMDGGNFAMEVSIAVEEGMEALFDARNVDDHLEKAYGAVFPNAASESVLEERFPGFDFTLASNPTQAVWDLKGIGPEGQEILVQVKTLADASDALEYMEKSPDVLFAVSSNIYDQLTEQAPELSKRLIDLGESNAEFTSNVQEGLDTLAGNMGIDVPDSLGEMLPYVGEVALGIRLIYNIVSTERALKGQALSDRSRVHGVRALALMSRFGVTTVCASAGVAAGGAIGTAIATPGLGTLGGNVAGGLAGSGAAMLLNRRLQPRIEEVAMRLVGGDADDVFYLMNKQAVDAVGESLATTQIVAA